MILHSSNTYIIIVSLFKSTFFVMLTPTEFVEQLITGTYSAVCEFLRQSAVFALPNDLLGSI